jgi:hypothetical protein
MMADALLLTMMSPAAGEEAEFNDWVNAEHLPERRQMAGFRTALRFENKAASPHYLAIYDLEDMAVLQSAAYRAISGDNLSARSQRILAGATARWRFYGSRIGAPTHAPITTGAKGQVAELMLLRWRNLPRRSDELIGSTLEEAVGSIPHVSQLRLFVGGADGRFDYVGIAESGRAFPVGSADTARYHAGSQSCDFAHVFVPLPVAGR